MKTLPMSLFFSIVALAEILATAWTAYTGDPNATAFACIAITLAVLALTETVRETQRPTELLPVKMSHVLHGEPALNADDIEQIVNRWHSRTHT